MDNDVVTGLEAVELETVEDEIHADTTEALSGEDEGEDVQDDLAAREGAYELYSQFCDMMEDMGADPPSEDRQRATANKLGKAFHEQGIQWIEDLDPAKAAGLALAFDWGPQAVRSLVPKIKQRLEQARKQHNGKRDSTSDGHRRQREDNGDQGQRAARDDAGDSGGAE
jgi:hypothetical protein